ncbi:MAG TPA: hypothetical protein VKB79_15050 [Bryobacteraceae bacterium]|nr:hypothetical protein [Bryobacteraceae bacterium]
MSDYLIQVSAVALNNGYSTTLKNYLNNGSPIPTDRPMEVRPGDRISWNLQVIVKGQIIQPAFHVHFFDRSGSTPDSSFFGQPTISAAGGQSTQFLSVLSLQGLIEYSIVAEGFGKVLDPQMQTGDGTDRKGSPVIAAQTPSFTVIWNYPTKSLSLQVGNEPTIYPFPSDGLSVKRGDTVAFVADGPDVQQAGPLEAEFVYVGNSWISPFTQSQQGLPLSLPGAPLVLYSVSDNVDHANPNPPKFPFDAENNDRSVYSDTYQFVLAS